LDKSARGERFLAVHRRRQRDAGALARRGDQNIEAPCRKNHAKISHVISDESSKRASEASPAVLRETFINSPRQPRL
jgi:hypothetical protein